MFDNLPGLGRAGHITLWRIVNPDFVMLQQKNVVAQEIASLIQDQYATPKCTTEAKRNKVLHVIASFLYKSSEMKQHKAIAPIDRWLLSQSLLNHNLTRKLGVTRK